MVVDGVQRSTEEWQQRLGEQVRAARIAADLRQDDVAYRADISVTAVQDLERGRGSSVATLVKVLRALDQTDWIETLAPVPTVSPLAMANAQRKTGSARVAPRQRVARRRGRPQP